MTLTRESILSMEPGRELDTLVAEKVMGWKKRHNNINNFNNWVGTKYKNDRNWKPSIDISAAWEVIEKIQKKWSWDMGMYNEAEEVEVRIGTKTVVSVNVTEAICKAALLTTLEAVEE